MQTLHSVIVPVYNGSSFIHLLWESLVPSLLDSSEIIVVDDGSTEDISRLLPCMSSVEVKVLRNETSRGYAHAVNRGLNEACGEFIYILNTDLILGAGALELIYSFLRENPEVGVVGAKLLYPQTGLIQHFGLAFSETRKFHIFTHMEPTHPLVSRLTEFQAVTFALCGLRRDVFRKVGNLNPRYVNGCEDIDYSLRVRDHGYKLVVPPDVSSYHWESLSGESRHASTLENEARFWGDWSKKIVPDMEIYLQESLGHYMGTTPGSVPTRFTIVNFTQGNDFLHILSVLSSVFRAQCDVWDYTRAHRRKDQIMLPMTLPFDAVRNPTPFLFLVQEYPQLLQNHYWFSVRNNFCSDDIIFDLYGNIRRTSDPIFFSLPARQKSSLDVS